MNENGQRLLEFCTNTLCITITLLAMLQYAFQDSPGDVYLHWRTDGSLFTLARLRAKTKTKSTTVRDLLFADNAALVAHSE